MQIGDKIRLNRKPFFTGTINGEQFVLDGVKKTRDFYIGWSFKPEWTLSHKTYNETELELVTGERYA